MYIETIESTDATGNAAELYARERGSSGFVPNYVEAFSHRPELYEAWGHLNRTIKSTMDLRVYELATFAAAKELRSSYCVLAHGEVLATKFFPAEVVRRLAHDHRNAGLSEADVAVMDFASKVARDAGSITRADVIRLQDHGFSDADVFDIGAAAAARSFFTKVLEAVGVQPDAEYRRLEPDLRDALTVGRPIED